VPSLVTKGKRIP